MRITQLINNRGNAVANQTVVTTDTGTYFQSYNTVVAHSHQGEVTLSQDFDCSATTLKHVKIFLGVDHTKKAMHKMIADGTYKLVPQINIV